VGGTPPLHNASKNNSDGLKYVFHVTAEINCYLSGWLVDGT
jgi:hypothetical protein